MLFRKKLSPAALMGYGGNRTRTDGPLRAKQVLSQLSYTPYFMGLGRFELPTSRLSGVRSYQLSYRPIVQPVPEGRKKKINREGNCL
jgi:hypothetical protein